MKTFLEIQTPQLLDIERCVSTIAYMDGFDSIILEEIGGISAVAFGAILRERCPKEIFIKIACRDRNRIALHSELTTAAAADIVNVVVADGTHPARTPFPDAKPVYDLDAISLLRMLKGNTLGSGAAETSTLGSLPWKVGVCIGGSTPADILRARKFAAAGADIFFVWSLEAVAEIRRVTDRPIFLSVHAEHAADTSGIRAECEVAGASGLNVVAGAADKVLNGNIIRRAG